MQNKKWFLYVTDFFAGISVMAIELGASRLLAPYFSSSQIVWTVIIGTIMIAMAAGNLIGGRLADKNPDPERLYMRLFIVAVWCAAIPFAGKYVIALVSLILASLGGQGFLIWASLVSCLILFVAPLLLLGTVSPSLIKYTVSSLGDNGRTVGELGALNTLGSIIGTFLPTFVTIPAVGTSWTFIIFASVLLMISLIYFISNKKKLIKSAVALALTVAFAFLSSFNSFAFWGDGTLYEDESIYNYLQVSEDEREIRLSTNVLIGVQSVKMKNGELSGNYYDFALAAPLMANAAEKDPLEVLIIGFGTGTYATECRKYFPASRITGVEIDRKIIDLAYSKFGVDPDDENIKVVEFDGRAYLRNAGKYDVIMVDAYRDITVPFQMSSVEFFSEVKDHMTSDGVMVLNLNMTSDSEGSLNERICDTVSAVFDNVYCFDVSSGNREVFATMNKDAVKTFSSSLYSTPIDLTRVMLEMKGAIKTYEAGEYILTDDNAPVELLGMRTIDELISDEIGNLQNYLKDHSLFDLVEFLN